MGNNNPPTRCRSESNLHTASMGGSSTDSSENLGDIQRRRLGSFRGGLKKRSAEERAQAAGTTDRRIGRAAKHKSSKTVREEEVFLAAARVGDVLVMKELIKAGIDINAFDQNKQTALHYAAINFRLEAIQLLVSKGANCNITDLKGGFTPLHWIVINAEPEVASNLVEQCLITIARAAGSKVNCGDFNLSTPLHIASQRGHRQCCRLLVQLGADCQFRDIMGRTPLNVAHNEETRQAIIRAAQEKFIRDHSMTPESTDNSGSA